MLYLPLSPQLQATGPSGSKAISLGTRDELFIGFFFVGPA